MKKNKNIEVSEDKILQIFELLKAENNASKTTLAKCLGVSRMTVHNAVNVLLARKWIKERARIGIVASYKIINKD